MKIKANLEIAETIPSGMDLDTGLPKFEVRDLGSLPCVFEVDPGNVLFIRPYIDKNSNKTDKTQMEYLNQAGENTTIVIDYEFSQFYKWWLEQTGELISLKILTKKKE